MPPLPLLNLPNQYQVFENRSTVRLVYACLSRDQCTDHIRTRGRHKRRQTRRKREEAEASYPSLVCQCCSFRRCTEWSIAQAEVEVDESKGKNFTALAHLLVPRLPPSWVLLPFHLPPLLPSLACHNFRSVRAWAGTPVWTTIPNLDQYC